MINAPVVDTGVNPATVPPMTITDTSSIALTPRPPDNPAAVGISVGNTTPSPELKKDMIPATTPMTIAAIVLFMTFSRAATMISIPPEIVITFIKIPTPSTIKITFHGIAEIAFFSSAHPNTIRIDPTRNPVNPT